MPAVHVPRFLSELRGTERLPLVVQQTINAPQPVLGPVVAVPFNSYSLPAGSDSELLMVPVALPPTLQSTATSFKLKARFKANPAVLGDVNFEFLGLLVSPSSFGLTLLLSFQTITPNSFISSPFDFFELEALLDLTGFVNPGDQTAYLFIARFGGADTYGADVEFQHAWLELEI